jgi:hypothetical protein
VNRDDVRVPAEIFIIESQQMGNFVDHHRCHQSGVIDFDAQYRMRQHKPPPLVVHIFIIWKEGHAFLESVNSLVSLFTREAKPIQVGGPRSDVPELRDILMRVVEHCASFSERGDSPVHNRMIRVIPAGDPQEDIRVAAKPSVMILVDHFAGKGFSGHRRDVVRKLGRLIEPSPNFLWRTAWLRSGWLRCGIFEQHSRVSRHAEAKSPGFYD